MALLRPNKGTAPATGKVKPSRAELLMSATQALAAEQLPDAHTMNAIEGDGGSERSSERGSESGSERSSERGSENGSESGSENGGAGNVPGASSSAVDAATATPLVSAAGPHLAPSNDGHGSHPTSRRVPGHASAAHASDASGSSSPQAEVPGTGAAAETAAAETTTIELRAVGVDAIRPSPFQPKGRPSAAAVESVRQAIVDAGSLDALVSPDGAPLFARLTPEAARLAELAYDVAEHGMKVPVEIRTIDNGQLECLSGHRRLAAARLAGLPAAPAIERGAMSNAAAAATVLRGNLHRENFTTWQEAALVTEVQERRRADGFRDNVRTLGAVMGWSHGKVNMLLRIRRALSPELLARAGRGDVAPVEELLARAAYRDLERLASEADEERRITATRRMLGLGDVTAAGRRERERCIHRPKRGGGFVIEVNEPVESLEAGDATLLRTYLEAQLTRVHARLGALGHH